MSESDSKQPRHGRVTNPESRGSYAIKKAYCWNGKWSLWKVAKTFPTWNLVLHTTSQVSMNLSLILLRLLNHQQTDLY